MYAATPQTVREHRLSLVEVLDMLVWDGLVAQSDAEALLASQARKPEDVHPLLLIGRQKWPSKRPPNLE